MKGAPSALGLCRQQPGKPSQTFVTLVSPDQSNSGKDGNVFPASICLELDCLTSYLDHLFVVIFFQLATSSNNYNTELILESKDLNFLVCVSLYFYLLDIIIYASPM